MPRVAGAQVLGDRAELWFRSQLPDKWLFQQPTRDVGVDGVVVVCEEGELNGLEFRVQVKSSKLFRRRGKHLILRNVKRSTVRYWFSSPIPTLLVLYEHSEDRGYYSWHSDLFDVGPDLRTTAPARITLRVPASRPLHPPCWDDVRRDLYRFYESLASSLATARAADAVMPAVHALIESLRGLHFSQFGKPETGDQNEEQEKLLLLLDVTCHRDAVITLRELVSKLHPSCEAYRQLSAFMAGYTAEVSSFAIPFEELVDTWDADAAVNVNTVRMAQLRPVLMKSLMDTISLLTRGSTKRSHKVAQGAT